MSHSDGFGTWIPAVSFLVGPIFSSLIAVALLSTRSPTLYALSSHGKTHTSLLINENFNGTRQPLKSKRLTSMTQSFLETVLTSDKIMVNKCRFADFYFTGIIMTLYLTYIVTIHQEQSWCTQNDNLLSDVPLSCMKTWIPTLLLLLHLIRRLCECIWVQKSESNSLMHLGGYLLGHLHYLCLPFIFIPISFRQPLEIYDKERDASHSEISREYDNLSATIYVIITMSCLFFQWQQHQHHLILASLRIKQSSRSLSNSSDTKGLYCIPYGGWFEYLTCPHYLSEIMIYLMFAVLLTVQRQDLEHWKYFSSYQMSQYSNLTIPLIGVSLSNVLSFLFLIDQNNQWIVWLWVVTNLSISASRTHEWYLSQFKDLYPQHRRRIIPFVW